MNATVNTQKMAFNPLSGKVIRSQFESQCKICGWSIEVDELIHWNPNVVGLRSWHHECALWAHEHPEVLETLPKPRPAVAPTGKPKWASDPSFNNAPKAEVAEPVQVETQPEVVLTTAQPVKCEHKHEHVHEAPAKSTSKASEVRDGYYTVVFTWNGEETRRTLRFQTPKDGAFAGKQVVGMLTGSDNTSSYENFGFVFGNRLAVWKRCATSFQAGISAVNYLLDSDQMAAAKAYALHSGNCYRCGRLLTTPESIEAGIGPVCAQKEM